MIIASIADLHARGKDLAELAAQLDAATDAADAAGADIMLCSGDVFDRPGIGDSHASTGAIAEVVCRWAARVGEILPHGLHLIHGNHDLAGSGSRDALHVLDQIARVHVHHEPELCVIDGHAFAFMPWQWSGCPLATLKSLMAFPISDVCYSILCAHVQVIGAALNAGHACEAKPGAWQISRADLAALHFDRYILGDFHRRQEVVEGRGGYVGALRQLNHGEETNPAGIEIYDTVTGAVEWIELNAAPRYRTILIVNPAAEALSPVKPECGERLRVQIVGDPDRARVAQLEAAGVTVERIVERVERVRRAEVPTGILADSHALLRLWSSNQQGFEPERETRMMAAFDHLQADRTVTA